MSLAPSCPIHPTCFLDCSLRFLRYIPSSKTPKVHCFALVQHCICTKNVKTPFRMTPLCCAYNTRSSQRHWIDSWKQTQLQKKPQSVVDYNQDDGSEDDSSRGGGSTMDRIVEKLKRFGYVDEDDGGGGGGNGKGRGIERGSVDDIFYVEEGMLPNSRGGFSEKSPLGMDMGIGDGERVRFPWEKKEVKEEVEGNSIQSRRSRSSLAELTLPEFELRRLRHLAIRMKEKTKIGGAGVTQEIVDKIHEKWRTSEVVRLKCEGAPALNMKRMHEILERKTGGLVIWRSGTAVSLYRGVSYELPSMQPAHKQTRRANRALDKSTLDVRHKISDPYVQMPHQNVERDAGVRQEPDSEVRQEPEFVPEVNYETEIDKLLDALGPRYTDWPGDGPLPVDADLLPGVVPGYKPPFRILPYGVRSTLGNRDMTALRRLARVLPPHFALGRSRQHQGLAVAMIKLWESSSVAKIALKRGVQLTTSERMAEDIKKMTGGTILTRNKDYLVFYRGKDFLSPEVSEALLERERLAKTFQDEEEQARLRASAAIVSNVETVEQPGPAGTLGETLEADARWGKMVDEDDKDKMMRAAEAARHAGLVRKLERKLFLAERKLTKAGNVLSKVEAFLKPANQPADPESINDEERYMFRKLGLKMKAFLLLGRRGVFDGTVENMHLHWKYRELVKIIVKAKNFEEVKNIALSLESESGGVLVSVDKISKGYAIIVFRGKDYHRPQMLRPKNLLTKRKALARSVELQRREALFNHISTLHKRVEQLKSELGQMESVKDQGDEELYVKLDSAYLTEDEDTEEEDDEAYLETYDSEIPDGDDMINYLENETNYNSQNMEEQTEQDASELHILEHNQP